MLLMVATNLSEESQATNVVKFCVLPSVNVPVAENCLVVLDAMLISAEAGDTVIDTNLAGVTASVATLEVIPEKPAVTVVVPSATATASPFVPDVLLIVAIPVFEEVQVTDDVISSVVVPPEKIPMAVNGWVCPTAMLWLAGVTAIDTKTA
jgi:hypothetical protein